MIGPQSHLLRPLLYVYHICIFDELIELIHLHLLHLIDLPAQSIEEPDELLSDLVAQVEVGALDERDLLGGEDLAEAEVEVLEEALGGRLQQEDLVVVVLVVGQVATLLTHQLLVHHAVGYVVFVVIGT